MGTMSEFSEKGSFGGHAIFQYMSTTITLISGLVFYLLIIRIFDTSIVGTISLLNSITGLFAIVFCIGLPAGLQHYISYYIGKDDYSMVRRIIVRFLGIIILISLSSVAFLYVTAPYISFLFFHEYSSVTLLRLLILNLAAFILINLFNAIMLGLQRFKKSAMLMIFGTLATYSCALLLLNVAVNPSMVVIGWGIGNVIDSILFVIVILTTVLRLGSSDTVKVSYKPVFTYSFPVFLATIISFGANYTDRFAVAFFLNLSDVGIYNIAMLVGTSLLFFVVPINSMLLPKFSELFARTGTREVKDNIGRSINFLTFMFTPMALLIAAISPSVMQFLGGTEYLGGSWPLSIMLISYALFVSANVLIQGLSGTRHTKVLVISSIVPLVTNVVLSIVLIPRFLLIGAASALGLTSMADFFIVYYYSRRFDLSNFDIKTISKLWISSILMFALVFFLQTWLGYSIPNIVLYVAVGLFFYLVMNKALKAIDPGDLEFIFSLMPIRLNFLKGILKKLFVT